MEDIADSRLLEPVYNCSVEDFHTYFVGSDDWCFSIWAHNACEFGFDTYNKLKATLRRIGSAGREVHHLIEQRFAEGLGLEASQMLSMVISKANHQVFTKKWRDLIGYSRDLKKLITTNAQWKDILKAANKTYKKHPEILEALKPFFEQMNAKFGKLMQ